MHHPMRVTQGSCLCLHMINTSKRTLRVSILCLQPDWGIVQLLPAAQAEAEFILDPKTEHSLRFDLTLPPGHRAGRDLFRVFVTQDSCDYGPLQMTSLSQPMGTGMSSTPRKEEVTRRIELYPSPADTWWMEAIEIEIESKAKRS